MRQPVAPALRQRDGILHGRVEDVGLGVGGEQHQAVAVSQLGHRPEFTGREVPPIEEACRAAASSS